MSDRRLANPELCKHADWLIVQRNYGYRWVTCTECHTDFFPESDAVAAVRGGVESGTIKGVEHKGWLVIQVSGEGEDR